MFGINKIPYFSKSRFVLCSSFLIKDNIISIIYWLFSDDFGVMTQGGVKGQKLLPKKGRGYISDGRRSCVVVFAMCNSKIPAKDPHAVLEPQFAHPCLGIVCDLHSCDWLLLLIRLSGQNVISTNQTPPQPLTGAWFNTIKFCLTWFLVRSSACKFSFTKLKLRVLYYKRCD